MPNIIYQDHWFVVVDKPNGIASVPTINKNANVYDLVKEQFPELQIVHRLDRETSGVLLFARGKPAMLEMHRLFRERSIHKKYFAVCEGKPLLNQGTIESPIIKANLGSAIQKVDLDGKPSFTKWQHVSSWLLNNQLVSKIHLEPKTGRTHQLRVHLKALGHPILGDYFYNPECKHPRLMLHAQSLSFQHPYTEQWINFESQQALS